LIAAHLIHPASSPEWIDLFLKIIGSFETIVEFALKVIGSFAVIVALFLTWRTHSQRATFDMIDRLYSLCHILHAHLFANWQLAHLFCVGVEDYSRTKRMIENRMAGEVTDNNEWRIKEKLFATHVFIAYEQVYYQWKQSRFMLGTRKNFLDEMLQYFTRWIHQNPRLHAILQKTPKGSLHLEECSVAELTERLIRQGPLPTPDFEGPFGESDARKK
jgi:hypothetical protein